MPQPPDPNPAEPQAAPEHRLLTEPASGTPVLMAPRRKARPILTTRAGVGSSCPFCTGAEAETPPETDAIRRDGSAPDTPGWRVRAFPNKFSAWHHHEVLAEGPEHSEQPADLGEDLWADVLELAGRRVAVMEAAADVRVAFWFRNVGREAGASIRHNHSQIMGLPEVPPRLATALSRWQEGADGGAQGEAASRAAAGDRIVWADGKMAVLAPEVPRLPFETWIAPVDPATHPDPFAPDLRGSLARALRTLCRAIQLQFNGPPLNIWLNRVPGTGFPWHFQAQPRTGYLAGLELGGGMTINAVPGADAAQALRRAIGADPAGDPPGAT